MRPTVAQMSMWEAIVGRGAMRHFSAGELIARHGDRSAHCFAILEGDAVVSMVSSKGATVVLGRRGPGTLVGELAALTGTPRSGNVTAESQVSAAAVSAALFDELLTQRPDLAVSELRRLAAEYRTLSERLAVRSEHVSTRIVALLTTHAETTGERVFRSTREELAGWVGATREAATRSLRELEAEGMVILRRGAVELA